MPTLPPERHIMTVTGRIEPAQLGPTLPHEHLYFDLSAHSGKADNDLTDVQVMAKEFRFFRTAGGCSIVDVTPHDNVIEVRACVPLVGDISVDLLRVQTSRT